MRKTITSRSLAGASTIVLSIVACTPDLPEGHFSCVASSDCPEGWTCVDERCYSSADVDAGSTDATVADASTDAAVDACQPLAAAVDLLLVADASASMQEEQAILAEVFPQLLLALALGDTNLDGTPDMPGIADLRVGVITSEMGTGGYAIPGCDGIDPYLGNDAELRTSGNTMIAGCDDTYPPFLEVTDRDMISQIRQDFSCVARVPPMGCGFEQPLDAALKAVTPQGSPIEFQVGSDGAATRGQADRANAGFFRPDAALVVLVVSDEDDCSASDPELFNPTSATYTSGLNGRCWREGPGPLHPIARYADGLRAAVSSPQQLVFGVLGGIPEDLAGATPMAILADERMIPRGATENPDQLEPVCSGKAGNAFPGARLVRTAEELRLTGSRTTVHSICSSDYQPFLQALMDEIAPLLTGC